MNDKTPTIEQIKAVAEQGHPEAQFYLATLYYQGAYGLDHDLDEAFSWYKKAAEQGHLRALFNAGLMLLHGEGRESDPEAALRLHAHAAEQGLPDA